MVQSEIEERDDYSGFNETDFSIRTAKMPAHEAAGDCRGSTNGIHRFLSCLCLSYSKKLSLHVLLIPDGERMSTPPGFKDPAFISLKLSAVSFWNKDLMSLQDGGEGGDAARGQ
ncbi:hypothetical protein ALC56_09415 [Trachymyrmex septentrionalis]|uniref:Uncharacterized protein n=1 Tax=Trachymyrmex septentrionalis TaxID=34720 RepID=A0A195F8T0_9HYME|nr:hypothetical protein ALC56_09415 [Trachymyrmex septentrionalis]